MSKKNQRKNRAAKLTRKTNEAAVAREHRVNSSVNGSRGVLNIDGEVGYWGVTAKHVRTQLEDMGRINHLEVNLNCPGGSISEGLAIHGMLKRHAANVTVYIQGYAASMGSQIAMAGNDVVMSDNALFMIHNPMGGVFGDAEAMRDEATVLDKHKEALINTYLSREAVTLSRDDLWDAMQAGTWYTAQEALDAGFVDSVEELQIDDEDDVNVNLLLADLPVDKYESVPDWVQTRRALAVQRAAMRIKEDEEDMSKRRVKNTAAPAAPTSAAPAVEPAPVVVPAPVEPAAPVNIADIQAEERARINAIRQDFTARVPGASEELINRYIDQGRTAAEVSSVIDDLLEIGRENTSVSGDAEIVADERDKVRTGMTDSLLSRTGVTEFDPQNEFNGFTLVELSSDMLRRNNVRVTGSRTERVGAAFTHSSSDFPNVLADVARRSLLAGYSEMPETFEQFTRRAAMQDFRAHDRVGMSEMETLEALPDGGEYKRGTMADYKETNRLATYGKMFPITRQTIINDDLGALTDIPAKMGRAARRTVAGKVFDVFALNPAMGDGTVLFHADHSNLNASSTAISTDSVDAIGTAMALNTGRNTGVQPMGLVPDILLVPMALRSRANTVRGAEYKVFDGATDTNRDPNSVRDTFRVIADARLDSISAVNWFMISSALLPIEVAYLDGVDTPFMDQVRGWEIDGTEFKVRIDVGVAPIEWASIYKQIG